MGPGYRFFQKIHTQGPETVVEKILFSFFEVCGILYGVAGWLRGYFYRHRILSSYRASVPVISVGNLTAGGTGKTPVVDHISRLLLAKGKKTAVVSRGYGRKEKQGLKLVCAGKGPLISPQFAGDEPFLLSKRNPDLVVIAAIKRSKGIAAAVDHHGAEVVILDDGFQHLAVQRDLDIVLLDANHPFGNNRLLPAGPLREFPSALKRSDLLILTRAAGIPRLDWKLPGKTLTCRHVMSTSFRTLSGDTIDSAALRSRRGAAFAGIASPGQFFSDLKSLALNIEKSETFRDHVNYGKMELGRLRRLASGADYLVTTEKDAVKLRQEDLSVVCYVAPLTVDFFAPEKLETWLENLF